MGRKGYHWIDHGELSKGPQKTREGPQNTNFDNFSPNLKRTAARPGSDHADGACPPDRLGWVQKWSDDQQLVLRVVLCIKQKHQSVVCPWNNDQRRVSRMHGSYILDVGAQRETGGR